MFYGQLVAGQVTSVTTSAGSLVRVANRTAGTEIFFTVDGADPTVEAVDAHLVPGMGSVTTKNETTSDFITVKMISTATPRYLIEENPNTGTSVRGSFGAPPPGASMDTPNRLVGHVNVDNFPSPQPVSGTVAVSNLSSPQPVSGSVSVGNFPTSQSVSGAVSVTNLPATQPVSGSVSVTNFPATQPVSGSVSVGNFPATQTVSGSVSVSNFPTTTTTDVARNSVTFLADGVTTVLSEALLSLSSYNAGTTAGGATSYTVPTGKTLRLTGITYSVTNSLAITLTLRLRAVSSGTLLTSSPLVLPVGVPAAGSANVGFLGGLDFPGGYKVGVTQAASVATGILTVSMIGYLL